MVWTELSQRHGGRKGVGDPPMATQFQFKKPTLGSASDLEAEQRKATLQRDFDRATREVKRKYEVLFIADHSKLQRRSEAKIEALVEQKAVEMEGLRTKHDAAVREIVEGPSNPSNSPGSKRTRSISITNTASEDEELCRQSSRDASDQGPETDEEENLPLRTAK